MLRRSCALQSDRTGKVSSFAHPVRFIKSGKRDTPKLSRLGTGKFARAQVPRFSSAMWATIYSDVLPLENRSYMNREKEINSFIDSLFSSSSWKYFPSLEKITHTINMIFIKESVKPYLIRELSDCINKTALVLRNKRVCGIEVVNVKH